MAQITFIDKDNAHKQIELSRITLIYGTNGSGKTTMLKTLKSENIVVCSLENEAKIIWELKTTLAERLPNVKKLLLDYAEREGYNFLEKIVNGYEVGNDNMSDGQKQIHCFIQSLIYGICKYGGERFTLVVDNFLCLLPYHTLFTLMSSVIELLYEFDIRLVAATPSIEVPKLFKEVIPFCENSHTLNIQETFKFLNIVYLDKYGAYVNENGSFVLLEEKYSNLP